MIVGSTNSVSAPSPQSSAARRYAFASLVGRRRATPQHHRAGDARPPTPRPSPNRPGAGLVGGVRLRRGVGGTAADDVSGTGNTARSPGATWTAAGRFGGALSFDGVNDWVTVPDAAALDLTNGMTLEAWVRPSANGGWRTAILKEQRGPSSSTRSTPTTAIRPQRHVFIGSTEIGTRWAPPRCRSTPGPTSPRPTTAPTLRLYVNGTQVATRRSTGTDAPTSRPAADRRQRRLGRVVQRPDRRGPRLQPRADREPRSQTDMNAPVGGAPRRDTTPPSAPDQPDSHRGARNSQPLWNAATDNVGVTRLRGPPLDDRRLHAGGRQPHRHADRHRLRRHRSPPGTYYYRVNATRRRRQPRRAPRPRPAATATADTTAPTVSVTAPAAAHGLAAR